MQFVTAQSTAEAARLLAESGGAARVLAGGTDLLVQMKSGMVEPATIIDIKKIPGMMEITEEDGGYRIGAGVRGRCSANTRASWRSGPASSKAAS